MLFKMWAFLPRSETPPALPRLAQHCQMAFARVCECKCACVSVSVSMFKYESLALVANVCLCKYF
jgi:hypothetical protein